MSVQVVRGTVRPGRGKITVTADQAVDRGDKLAIAVDRKPNGAITVAVYNRGASR
jgi:hypothetical protein